MNKPQMRMSAVPVGATLIGAPALAEEFSCTGAVGAVARDNLFVPDGAVGVLDRTRMKGSVVVGGSVQAFQNLGGLTFSGNRSPNREDQCSRP